MTAPWITQRAGRRPAPVATALPSGDRAERDGLALDLLAAGALQRPGDAGPIHSWSFAAFATASTSSAAMSPSTTSSCTRASSQAVR